MITGVNGSGKTQLLEVIAGTYGALRPRYPSPTPEIPARAFIEGDAFALGEVFHAYDEWLPLGTSRSSAQHVRQTINDLLRNRKGVSGPDAQDFGSTQALLAALSEQSGTPIERLQELSEEQFSKKFFEHPTPGQLAASQQPHWHTNDLAFLFQAYRWFEWVA